MEAKSNTILIVEDDAGLCELLKEIVGESGFNTASVQTAKEAKGWLGKNTPYFIILDYSLPDMNGKEFIAELKTKEKAVPPFIVSTGQGDERIAVEMMKLGAKDYVIKDINFIDIIPIVVNRVAKEIENENKLIQAEQMIQESEVRYRSLFEGVPVGLYRTTISGQILEFNFAAIKMLGYEDRENMMSHNSTDFWVNPDERKKMISMVDQSGDYDLEIEMRRSDKKIIWVHNKGRAEKDENGTILYFEGSLEDITERKKAEKDLKESNELLTLFMLHSPVYTYIKDVSPNESRVLKVSGNFHEMIGIPSSEMIGKTMQELFPLEFAEKITTDDWEVVSNNKLTKLDEDLNGRNYNTIKFPIRLGERNLLAGYTIDITDRKQAEKAVKDSEERFRELSNLLPQTVFETDLKGNLTYVNQMAFTLFGYSPADIEIGLNAFDMLIPSDRIVAMQKVRMIISENKPSISEYTAIKKDQTTFPIVLYSNAIVNNNQVVGIRGLIFDITDRKRAENEIRKSEERLQLLLNSVTDYIYSVKIENGHVKETIHGEGCITVTGYSTKEFNSDKNLWIKIVHDLDKDAVQDHIKNILLKNEIPIEHRIIHKNGTIRWVRNTPVIHNNSENVFTGYDGLISDITELREAQRQILNASIEAEENERSYFARELHDGIGPLLSTIKLYLQWLNKPHLQTPKEEIIANTETTILEAITAVREISHKLSPHVLLNFGLLFAIKSFINKLEETSSIKISLTSNIEERFEKEIEVTLYRVIIECINNTIKYAQAENISIKLIKEHNAITAEYTDNGIGFNYEETLKIGKGLGLFNMQNRIAVLGGSLGIESERKKGVKVKIAIPIN